MKSFNFQRWKIGSTFLGVGLGLLIGLAWPLGAQVERVGPAPKINPCSKWFESGEEFRLRAEKRWSDSAFTIPSEVIGAYSHLAQSNYLAAIACGVNK